MAQIPRKWHSLIPRKAPTQAALPRMTRNHAPHSGRHDQTFQSDRPSFGGKGLKEKGEDGNASDVFEEAVEVLHAEKHGDGVEPGGYEADGYGTHDGDGDHFFGAVYFFCEMSGAVEASEGPICVD